MQSPGSRIPRTALLSDLTKDETDDLTRARTMFPLMYKTWEAEAKAYTVLFGDIYNTVDPSFHPLLDDCTTVHELLQACQKEYKPPEVAVEDNLLKRWEQLSRAPNIDGIPAWISQWRHIYVEAGKEGIVELKNRKAISALLAAVEIHVSVAWAETESVLVGRSKGEATFDDVCESFLEYWRENETVMRAGKKTGNGRTRHGIFAVATNKTEEGVGILQPSLSGKTNKGEYTHCICGSDEHKLVRCPYAIHTLRLSSRKGDRKTQERVDDKIERRPRLARLVEKYRSEAKKGPNES